MSSFSQILVRWELIGPNLFHPLPFSWHYIRNSISEIVITTSSSSSSTSLCFHSVNLSCFSTRMARTSLGMACLLIVLCMVAPSLATVYTVGDTSGWTTGVDYSAWTKDKTFKVGDSLVFNYPTSHTVDEVSSSDYTTCTVGNAITTDNTGATTVALKTAGTHYFICGVIGHCGNGMKLAVQVESGSSTAPSKSPSSSSSPPSGDKPSTTTPSTTTTSTNVPDSSSSWSLSPFLPFVTSWVALFVMVIS